ncbi:MAG: universal stress protein [Chloroflexi bacterium]|nr:universal stress protein [Chloroflexota bacterium]
MYRKILVALDGSDAAKKALRAAVELARTHGASLHALGVEEHLPHYAATVGEVEEAKEEQDTFFGQVMAEAQRVAADHGVGLTTEVRAGNAAQQIVQAAREGNVDLVVLGARGHSIIRDFLLGTTTDRVTHHAPCSVLVVRA